MGKEETEASEKGVAQEVVKCEKRDEEDLDIFEKESGKSQFKIAFEVANLTLGKLDEQNQSPTTPMTPKTPKTPKTPGKDSVTDMFWKMMQDKKAAEDAEVEQTPEDLERQESLYVKFKKMIQEEKEKEVKEKVEMATRKETTAETFARMRQERGEVTEEEMDFDKFLASLADS